MPKLYEIPQELRAIEASIEEAEGEISPEIEAALTELAQEFDRKAEFIALLIREAGAEAQAVKAEEERLRARRQATERRAEGLKRYLLDCMSAMGVTKVAGQLASPAIQRNSQPTVSIDMEPDLLPDRWQRWKVEADTVAIRDAHKAGEPMPDGVRVVYGHHLRIR